MSLSLQSKPVPLNQDAHGVIRVGDTYLRLTRIVRRSRISLPYHLIP